MDKNDPAVGAGANLQNDDLVGTEPMDPAAYEYMAKLNVSGTPDITIVPRLWPMSRQTATDRT